jgi:hypothetical protein
LGREATAGEDVLLDEVGGIDVALKQGVVNHDALHAGVATGLEQSGHGGKVGRPVGASYRLHHFNGADGVKWRIAMSR